MDKQPSTDGGSAPRPPPDEESVSDAALTATVVAGLLDAVPDGVVLADAGGTILLVNRRLAEMFGYDRDDLLGRKVETLLPPDLRARHAGHRAAYAENPAVRPMGIGLALTGRRSDGSELPIEVSLSPLHTGDGQWAVAAVRDDIARQELERRRRAAAVADEQTRIAHDVADTVIRHVFAVGLALQSLLRRPSAEMRDGIANAIDELDDTIREVRNAVLGPRGGGPPPTTPA